MFATRLQSVIVLVTGEDVIRCHGHDTFASFQPGAGARIA
jgi:hypothetical protein